MWHHIKNLLNLKKEKMSKSSLDTQLDYLLIKKILRYIKNRPASLFEIRFMFNTYSSYTIEKHVKIMWHNGVIRDSNNKFANWFPFLNKEFDENIKFTTTLNGLFYV